MEDLIGIVFAILIVAVSAAAKSKKYTKKEDKTFAAFAGNERENHPQMKPAAPAAAAKVAAKKETAKAPSQSRPEDHRHEGRQDVPCPAVEREMPRIQREEKKEQPQTATVPGLNLTFDRNTVLQGFVMNEILNRPYPGKRR